MEKIANVLEEWRNYQLLKLKQELKMFRCNLLLSTGINIQSAHIAFITTERERKIIISSIDGIVSATFLFSNINGFTPNNREGSIRLIHGDQQHAILTFPTEVHYTSVLNQLRIFLREIENVLTPPSTSDDSHNSSSTSNE